MNTEWFEDQIEIVTQELDEARKREAAAKERMTKAVQEHGDAMRSIVHLTGLLRDLKRELDFERGREKK